MISASASRVIVFDNEVTGYHSHPSLAPLPPHYGIPLLPEPPPIIFLRISTSYQKYTFYHPGSHHAINPSLRTLLVFLLYLRQSHLLEHYLSILRSPSIDTTL